MVLKQTIYFLGEYVKNGEIRWIPLFPSSPFIHHLLVSNRPEILFYISKETVFILKCVLIEYKIIMIKSRVTGLMFPLSHKNCMTISTWDSLNTNLERVLALSKILLVDGHIIIIPLTPDTVPTPRLFYYGKYWKKSRAGSVVKTVVFSRSPLSIIFIQYNVVVARGNVQTYRFTVAASNS